MTLNVDLTLNIDYSVGRVSGRLLSTLGLVFPHRGPERHVDRRQGG